MVYEVVGKVFFVTGGASGIGAGFVRNVIVENPKHIAIVDLSEENGTALQNELNAKYPNKVKFYKVDVTNDAQLHGAYDSVVKEQGSVDVVINSAGILNDSLPVFKKCIDINVTALISSSFKAYELMRKDQGGKGGTIINISSIAGIHVKSSMPVYFATKAAVLQFTRCFADDDYYKRSGVRVITVAFGVTDTNLYTNMAFFDQKIKEIFHEAFGEYKTQKAETASQGLFDVYKNAENGEVWLSSSEKPVRNITPEIKEAGAILEKVVYD